MQSACRPLPQLDLGRKERQVLEGATIVPTTFTGIVHGRTIELERDTSFPDGATVQISLVSAKRLPIGSHAVDAILDSAGGWSDVVGTEFDLWLESTKEMRTPSSRDEFMNEGVQP